MARLLATLPRPRPRNTTNPERACPDKEREGIGRQGQRGKDIGSPRGREESLL